MILDGSYFTYGSFNSVLYDLVFVHTDSSIYTNMNGDIETAAVFNKKNVKRYYIGNTYTDSPISFEAEIATGTGEAIPMEIMRVVEKQLFHTPEYRKLYSLCDEHMLATDYNYSPPRRRYFNCRFINPSRIQDGSDMTVGYKFTIECDSYLMWEDSTVVEITPTDDSGIFSITTDIDGYEYAYPKVTILTGEADGTFTLINTTDRATRMTTFVDVPANTQIVMDCETNHISPATYYQQFSNKNFIRLLDGENVFSCSGSVASITFEWNNRRYVV